MTSVLQLGATGQTGRHLLASLLASSSVASVTEVGRRSAKDLVPPGSAGLDKLKLVQLDLANADDVSSKRQELSGASTVYITLGTTRKNAGSAEAFERIDRGYPVTLAKTARTEGSAQKLVYLSATGASASSPFLYPKSKGLTERELASLGYDETIVFRPGLLAGTERGESRLAEELYGKLTGLLSHFTDKAQIPVQELGPAMAKAGFLGYKGLEAKGLGKMQDLGDGHSAWVLSNADALKLAKADL